jgi:hypothetical protein
VRHTRKNRKWENYGNGKRPHHGYFIFAEGECCNAEKWSARKKENLLDRLFTPKQIADRGIFSLVTQWKEREKGRLKFYRIGRKILYSESQINGYLSLCGSGTEQDQTGKSNS